VERITKHGLVANGVEYPVDCIIFATGFEVGTAYARRSGYEIVGRTGQTLTEKWSQGVRTLHGMQSRDFPNCFIMSQTQGGFTVNYPHMLDELAARTGSLVPPHISSGSFSVTRVFLQPQRPHMPRELASVGRP
jgi:cyclohexanone monooxygenase